MQLKMDITFQDISWSQERDQMKDVDFAGLLDMRMCLPKIYIFICK